MLSSRRLQAPEQLEHVSYTHPFTHRPLVEFMLSIPPEEVCRPGKPRHLMRRAFAEMLPDMVLNRKSKAAFGAVFNQCLAPMAAEMSAASGAHPVGGDRICGPCESARAAGTIRQGARLQSDAVARADPFRILAASAVEEVLFAHLDEGRERVLEALLDLTRVFAGLQAADHVVAADQALAQR